MLNDLELIELLREYRDEADLMGDGNLSNLLDHAAERLEMLSILSKMT